MAGKKAKKAKKKDGSAKKRARAKAAPAKAKAKTARGGSDDAGESLRASARSFAARLLR